MATTAMKKQKKTPQKTLPVKPKKAIARQKETKKNQDKNVQPVIDFRGVKLTALRRDFIVYYCTPGQPCFHNALQAALKAGYKEAVAKSDIYGILQEPGIQKIIQHNEHLAHLALHESAKRAIELKQRRAFYDPADYFEEKEIELESKSGEVYKKKITGLKDLQAMTPEQRMCIDGMDIKGQASVPVYLMPDRGKELNDIIKMDNELLKSDGGDNEEEETMEIIMERLTLKKTVRKEKDEISQAAGLIRNPKGSPITEL